MMVKYNQFKKMSISINIYLLSAKLDRIVTGKFQAQNWVLIKYIILNLRKCTLHVMMAMSVKDMCINCALHCQDNNVMG